MSLGMYNAILKWSLNQADGFDRDADGDGDGGGDGADGPSLGPMSAERKEFLMRAMKQYIVNETERINDIVEILKFRPSVAGSSNSGGGSDDSAQPQSQSPSQASHYADVIKAAVDIKVDGGEPDINAMLAAVPPSAIADMKLEALRELQDRVEQVDNASFFACNCNGGGELPLLLDLLVRHPSGQIRAAAGAALATILQNNPAAQAKAGELPDFLPTVLAVASGALFSSAAADDAAAEVAPPAADALTSGESVQAQRALEAEAEAQAFGVLSSYVRGAHAAGRLALFLSPAVAGPEYIARALADCGGGSSSRAGRRQWVRYTPAGGKARDGWWRPLPPGAAVDPGAEVAMDLSSGRQWLRFPGEGTPPGAVDADGGGEGGGDDGGDHDDEQAAAVAAVRRRLVGKIVFFLQFVLREVARSKDSDASVARLLHRLGLVGGGGGGGGGGNGDHADAAAAALVALAGDTGPEAAAISEAAATALQLLLALPQGAGAAGVGATANATSDVIVNGGSAALMALPSPATTTSSSSSSPAGNAAGNAGQGQTGSGGGGNDGAPATVAEALARFRRAHGEALVAACAAQEAALVASAAGDEEQLSYLEEPRELFKALATAVRG